MPLDTSVISSGSTSPIPNEMYEHAVLVHDPHSTQKRPTQPRPRPANPMRRLNRADSHSSSMTTSSMSSLSKRLLLEIPRPSSTSALVEADLLPAGCFTTTSPVYDSLRSLADDDKASRRFRLPFPRFLLGENRSRDSSPARSTTSSLSPPGSPGSTFSSIPSISRTVSFDEPEHEHPTPPNHIRRASISTTSPAPPFSRRMSRTAPPSPMIPDAAMDPILAAAEDASRLRTNCICSMCGREGANFPRTRTGEVFCSRECRIGTRNRA